ncbi:phage tail domain-containing protein, partial [Periweissella ghanensis]
MRDVEVYIKKRGQAEFALSSVVSKDFHVLTAYMNSPQITPSYETMAGSDGGRLTNIVFNQTTFTIECFINGRQKSDFRLMRDEVYRHFYSREAVQVRTSLEPSKAVYVVPKPVDIISEKGYSGVAFNLQFDVLEGYRHTPYRSDELSTNQSKLQYGMGLDIENLPIYNFKANDFVVNNPSDMAIDPYIHRHDLK